jgi:hypothetical protein
VGYEGVGRGWGQDGQAERPVERTQQAGLFTEKQNEKERKKKRKKKEKAEKKKEIEAESSSSVEGTLFCSSFVVGGRHTGERT